MVLVGEICWEAFLSEHLEVSSKKLFTSWITASVLFNFVFICFFLVDGASLIEMIKNSCELDQLVRFHRPSADLEVKYKFSAYCWRRRCFGKLQDDLFLKFRKHFTAWRWLTINANFYILIKIPSLWTKWHIHNTILIILSTSNLQFKNYVSDGTHMHKKLDYCVVNSVFATILGVKNNRHMRAF